MIEANIKSSGFGFIRFFTTYAVRRLIGSPEALAEAIESHGLWH